MKSELNNILELTKNKRFNDYTSYFLSNYLSVKNDIIIAILTIYKEDFKNVKIYFNPKTNSFNNIGVIDTENGRIIDLDDDSYTMENKGIDVSIELKLDV